MEEFSGLFSLLVACIDLGLLVNLLIFSEKNRLNKSIILLITLFLIVQLLDFSFCFLNIDSSIAIFALLISLILQPALALFIVARYNNLKTKLLWLVFIPPVLFFFNFLFVIDSVNLAACTFFNAQYDYPHAGLFMLFYFLPIAITLLFLAVKIKSKTDDAKHNVNLFVLAGYAAALLSGLLLIAFVPGGIDSYEGIFSKLSLLPAFALALLALKNRTKNISEKE